ANLDAPACRASIAACAAVGARANRKVVCRMAPGIVPGRCDTWEHVFESEKPLCERYPSDLTDFVWRRLRHLLVRPHPKGERPCPCAAPGSAICGPTRATRQRRTGCEPDPCGSRSRSSAGSSPRAVHPASSLGRRADLLGAPLPTPPPPG